MKQSGVLKCTGSRNFKVWIRIRPILAVLLATVVAGFSQRLMADDSGVSAAVAGEKISFARDIRPILSHHCGSCHGVDEETREAGLRLDERESAIKARQGGAAIVPGKPEESQLIARIHEADESLLMPPPETKKPLTTQQKELLRSWISQGADYAPHWAFQPPEHVEPPRTKRPGWVRNPIDQFVLAKLESAGLSPSSEAPRETLLRRVTLDLTGLPPTVEELEAFLADRSPQAYEKVVDQLLDSPRYAERMAMHWLDVARYADTNGYNNDEERSMWPWRDWVIEAFLRNLPYDQFVVDQLAGDLIPSATLAQRVATGFNRNHVLTTEGGIVEDEYRVEYVADRVHTTATVFMGLSFQCARCHDHKFDPVSQREYYRFFAYFNNIPDGAVGYNRKEGYAAPFVKVPSVAQQAELDQVTQSVADLEQARQQRVSEAPRFVKKWETGLTSEGRAEITQRKPILHVALDETEGDSAIDAVDPARRGTVHGKPVWTAGKIAGALELDGATTVDLGAVAAVDAGNRFSISVWVFPTTNEAATVVSKIDEAAAYRGFDVILEGGKVASHLVDHWPDNGLKVITRDPLKLNEWHHLLVSYDGSRKGAGVKIYTDGKLQPLETTNDTLTGSLQTDKPFLIGRRSTSAPFKGRIDDLQIFAVELAAQDAARLAAAQPLPAISAILAVAFADRTESQQAELQQFYLERIDDEHRRIVTELAKVPERRAAIEATIPGVMVMEELPEARTTYMLKRGQYDQPGEVVTPGVPAALPALPEGATPNRLALARWLVDPSHPLTARVAVNRWWEMYFGTGLVETAEDFGVTGALPTHPELLDWLAMEFASPSGSGTETPRAWDIKRMQKLIVMSATYRQASTVLPIHRERDPKNLLLSRGPRFRLSAESVRDTALALAGLLVDKVGGPSVKPYQPEGLWEDVSVERREKYTPDPGDGLYRRTMYTFWKRTCPPPAMSTFDAPTRETCTIRRARTNTPLQALVLLNDPTYVEAARKMAERVLSSAPEKTVASRLRQAFRIAVARGPRSDEQAAIIELYDKALQQFRDDGQAAKELLAVGRSPANPELDPAELAAWTIVCATILNLDETISKE